jgi:uncharacterized protein
MKIELTPEEARVIGSLIEKQITTPDQYPLSLNALLAACNQKSNREPVMSLAEPAVQTLLDRLAARHLVVERAGFGSRVPKYQHRLCNTEAGSLKLSAQELAILTELLLRGPQTPGELRSRASRMAPFGDVSEVEAALEALAAQGEGPAARPALVVRLAREPGRREARHAHLLSGPVAAAAVTAEEAGEAGPARALEPQEERISRLEEEVRALRAELTALKASLGV